MRIFVAYGYNDRDKWIEKMVFPVIEAFGAEVETGELIGMISSFAAPPVSITQKIQMAYRMTEEKPEIIDLVQKIIS